MCIRDRASTGGPARAGPPVLARGARAVPHVRVARPPVHPVAQVRKRLPLEALQYSNHFRQRCCYIQQTADVLAAHRDSLLALYEHYAQADADVGDASSSAR
eukprot:5690447-Prymnesium_polylepis.1